MTGWSRFDGEYIYKPEEQAVREDMAVAIVKGLELTIDVDESILNKYADQNKMSYNLKKYIAKATDEGIMIGSESKDIWYFNPLKPLTRAEAATLLARLITEEKVVFDEEKITFDKEEETDDKNNSDCDELKLSEPILTISNENDRLVLNWTKVDDCEFKYYKVVASKNDETPEYSTNGYYKAISNIGELSCEIKAGHSYNGSDFGGKFVAGDRKSVV